MIIMMITIEQSGSHILYLFNPHNFPVMQVLEFLALDKGEN